MTFYESRVMLDFDQSWSVVAFDQTRFFKALAGQGLRGVDFLGIREQTLYLIEIKNYSPVKRAKRYRYGGSHDDLVVHLNEKYADSLRIVRIIESTLRRFLLYRIWLQITRHLAFLRRMGPSDWAFWTHCAELARKKSVVNVLILIDPLGQIATEAFPEDWAILQGDPPFAALPGLAISDSASSNRT